MNWKFDHRQQAADRVGEVAENIAADPSPRGPLEWEVPPTDDLVRRAQDALDQLRRYEIHGETCIRLNDAKALFQYGGILCAVTPQ